MNDDIMDLCDIVRETAYAIHQYHRQGHLEKVYENALAHRLRKLGLNVKQQHPLKVYGLHHLISGSKQISGNTSECMPAADPKQLCLKPPEAIK